MANSQSEGQRAMKLESERTQIYEDIKKQKEKISKKRQEEIERGLASSTTKIVKKRKDKTVKAKLSFATNDEDEEEAVQLKSPESMLPEKKRKVTKNPNVDTSFLPDKEREETERREREFLKLEWLKQQDKIKEEKIMITYSYWDGSGHRTQVEVKKGNTIGQFLEACKQQWDEMRGINVDNLIYIKEDLIIPHHYTFYDFIVNKVRGKSGPLFAFDVHDDVRLVNDASIETEESHAGKVVQRGWYEKNKHIFPASRWEVFDSSKEFTKYTIKDTNAKK
ncbi:Protein fam50a [Physocladia obscura]|uniref:Protein fam50a n=1 Tax=Physocladia obscura TaxID=109957 RepID=A0AAD5SZW2_9FUNG|nr:Protein fam50a [Physocladia obscura]